MGPSSPGSTEAVGLHFIHYLTKRRLDALPHTPSLTAEFSVQLPCPVVPLCLHTPRHGELIPSFQQLAPSIDGLEI